MSSNHVGSNVKKAVIFAALLLFGLISLFYVPPVVEGPFPGLKIVYAQDDWKKEFDDICSRTDDAMTLTAGELKDLIGRCERLKLLIEKLDETQRKVFLKRLQQCKDLLVFVLESQEKK